MANQQIDFRDYALSAGQLDDKYNPEGDGEHPVFPTSEWRVKVSYGDTLLGYWDWVEYQLEASAEVDWTHQALRLLRQLLPLERKAAARWKDFLDSAPGDNKQKVTRGELTNYEEYTACIAKVTRFLSDVDASL